MTATRAADDFPAIRARLEELRREHAAEEMSRRQMSQDEKRDPMPGRRERQPSEQEHRQRGKSEGLPPPWVPTIFAKRRAI